MTKERASGVLSSIDSFRARRIRAKKTQDIVDAFVLYDGLENVKRALKLKGFSSEEEGDAIQTKWSHAKKRQHGLRLWMAENAPSYLPKIDLIDAGVTLKNIRLRQAQILKWVTGKGVSTNEAVETPVEREQQLSPPPTNACPIKGQDTVLRWLRRHRLAQKEEI